LRCPVRVRKFRPGAWLPALGPGRRPAERPAHRVGVRPRPHTSGGRSPLSRRGATCEPRPSSLQRFRVGVNSRTPQAPRGRSRARVLRPGGKTQLLAPAAAVITSPGRRPPPLTFPASRVLGP
jgi:hypothetical protein